jgi:hypothetical protein
MMWMKQVMNLRGRRLEMEEMSAYAVSLVLHKIIVFGNSFSPYFRRGRN